MSFHVHEITHGMYFPLLVLSKVAAPCQYLRKKQLMEGGCNG